MKSSACYIAFTIKRLLYSRQKGVKYAAFCALFLGLFLTRQISAQNYHLFLSKEPTGQDLSAPENITLFCNSEGTVLRITRKNEKIIRDTLGVFPQMKWMCAQYADYFHSTASNNYDLPILPKLTRASANRVKAVFPIPTDFINPNIQLTWRPYQNTKTYLVFLTDRFNQVIVKKSVQDTSLSLNLSEFNLQKGVCYFWSVEAENLSDSRSDEICLTWVREEIALFVQEEIQKIDDLQGIDIATRHIMKAAVYEQHKLFIDALKEYRAACLAFPKADDLKRMYGMFLIRIGVIKSMREIWD